MPEPVRSGQRYLPGLDGLRALAVLAVVAYHVGFGWAPGGLLGVGVFFTLSGYIITDLLLGQRAKSGSLQLVDFWYRRARRLLPALFVTLTIVVGWVALLDRSQLSALRGAVAAAAAYVSNWWLIAQHQSYFARFAPPSPLGHLWSLAVEEQFYLIWPWLLFLVLRYTRARRNTSGEYYWLAAGSLVLAAGSAVLMAMLYHPGYDPTRVYDGTDTRAFALLIGAALAFVWPSRKLRDDLRRSATWALDGVGVVGLLVIFGLIWRTTQYSPFLYRGGLVVLSVATAMVVAAVASPASRVGKVLGVAPVRWIGVRSYGIYLWHFPIIVLTTPANSKDDLARASLQIAATVAVAALSWHFIEEPIRHGALSRWWTQLQSAVKRRSARAARRKDWATLAGGASVLGLAVACLAGVIPPAAASGPSYQLGAAPPPPPVPAAASQTGGHSGSGGDTTGHTRSLVTRHARGPRLRSSCRSVVHIGDSTSDGLNSPNYLPNPALRLSTQYARVGVRTIHWEISGGTSIVETLPGTINAYTAAQRLIRRGYHGCWVIALGTNDTADVFVGSTAGLAQRIQRMMMVIGDQPVMWVNVKSLLSSGPYSESDMLQWDHALLRACARHPNMRVYDWASVVRNAWFINDGIHFTSPGYAARSRLIARALAEAFPAPNPLLRGHVPVAAGAQHGSGCVVH